MIRAGFSKKTAKEQATRMLTNVHIKEIIKELQQKIQERNEITADMVVKELAKIGFANIQDYIESGNSINDISAIDTKKAAAISSIETTTSTRGKGDDKYSETSTKIKIWDKTKALEQLGRHLGIFEEDNKQSKIDSIEIIRTVISKKV